MPHLQATNRCSNDWYDPESRILGLKSVITENAYSPSCTIFSVRRSSVYPVGHTSRGQYASSYVSHVSVKDNICILSSITICFTISIRDFRDRTFKVATFAFDEKLLPCSSIRFDLFLYFEPLDCDLGFLLSRLELIISSIGHIEIKFWKSTLRSSLRNLSLTLNLLSISLLVKHILKTLVNKPSSISFLPILICVILCTTRNVLVYFMHH